MQTNVIGLLEEISKVQVDKSVNQAIARLLSERINPLQNEVQFIRTTAEQVDRSLSKQITYLEQRVYKTEATIDDLKDAVSPTTPVVKRNLAPSSIVDDLKLFIQNGGTLDQAHAEDPITATYTEDADDDDYDDDDFGEGFDEDEDDEYQQEEDAIKKSVTRMVTIEPVITSTDGTYVHSKHQPLSAQEVAGFLDCNLASVYRFLKAGKLVAIKMGKLYFTRESVLSLMRERKNNVTR